MRTMTATETQALQARHRASSLRVLAEDPTSTFQDLSAYAGRNWIHGVSWSAGIDDACAQASVTLRREAYGTSLSTLADDSPANAGGPLLDVGREIAIETATGPAGSAHGSPGWRRVFAGEVDATDVAAGAGVVLSCRDRGGVLLDAQIEAEADYGSTEGVALHLVMQQLLDATLGAGVVTLAVPAAPTFLVTTYTQQTGSLLEALQGLAALIGWVVREEWSETAGDYQLTLLEPDRAKTVADWVIPRNRYLKVNRLATSRDQVRNAIRLEYIRSDTGNPDYTFAKDDASIGKFGRRFMRLVETKSPIDTPSEAATMVNAALADLSTPPAELEVEMHYFWPVQLGDLLTFEAKPGCFDTDQTLAVVGIRHTFDGSKRRTIVTLRGKPAGAYRVWLQREVQVAGQNAAEAPIIAQWATDDTGSNASDTFDPAVHTYWRWSLDGGVTWTAWVPFVGQDGASAEGRYTDFLFQVAAAQPATPTGDAPAGWFDAPPAYDPATGEKLWFTRADRDGSTGALLGPWSIPRQISGAKGDTGATGPTGPTGPQGPQGPAGSSDPTCHITQPYVADGEDVGPTADVTFFGALGTGGVGPLEWRTRYDGDWSAWVSTALPVSTTVPRHPKAARRLELEVRDAALVVAHYSVTIAPRLPVVQSDGGIPLDNISDGTGYRRPAAAYVDTSGRVASVYRTGIVEPVSNLFKKASDTLDSALDSPNFRKIAAGFSDVSNRLVNVFRGGAVESADNLFKKSVDTLDSVAEGATYRRTTATEKAGAGYASTGLNAAGRLITGVEATADLGGRAVGAVRDDAQLGQITAVDEGLVPNGHFGAGATGWQVTETTGTPVAWSVGYYNASFPSVLSIPAGAQTAIGSRVFRVVPGARYRIRTCVWTDVGAPVGSFYLRIMQRTAWAETITNYNRDGFTDFLVGSTLDWQQPIREYDWVAPAGTNWANFNFYNYSGSHTMWCAYVEVIPYAAAAEWGAEVTTGKSLDVLVQGASQRWVDSNIADSTGKVVNVYRGGYEPATNLFKRNVDTLDQVGDSPTYVRTTPTERTGAGRAAVALDTNNRLTDQRRLNQVVSANIGALQQNLSISAVWDPTAGASGSWKITVSAHTVVYGFGSVSYNQGIAWAAPSSTAYLYYVDPDFTGGSKSLVASGAPQNVIGDGKYRVGEIVLPAQSGATITGTPGGSGAHPIVGA